MRLEQFKYLVIIGNSPSINAASQKLHISYQALNYSIKSFEQEIGVQLLKRTNKGSILTEDGRKITNLARQFILELQAIKEQKNGNNTQCNGNVYILAMDICLEYFLYDIIDYFRKMYCHVNIYYEVLDSMHQMVQILRNNPNTVCVSFKTDGYFMTNFPDDIRKLNLYHSDVCVVCSPMHKLNKYTSLTYEDIKSYPLLLRRDEIVKHELRGPFASDNISFQSNPNLFEKDIQFGNYYTFAHKIPCAPYWIPEIDNTIKIKIQDQIDSHLVLFYHHNFAPNFETKLFLNTMYSKLNVPQHIRDVLSE